MAALALLITAAASIGGGLVAQEVSQSVDTPKATASRVWRRVSMSFSFY
jgi:hypothetical protein